MESTDFLEKIANALDNTLCYKGLIVEGICSNKDVGTVRIDCDNENTTTYLKNNCLDEAIASFAISKMFKEGKIQFIGDCKEDVDYLKKLLGSE